MGTQSGRFDLTVETRFFHCYHEGSCFRTNTVTHDVLEGQRFAHDYDSKLKTARGEEMAQFKVRQQNHITVVFGVADFETCIAGLYSRIGLRRSRVVPLHHQAG